jgi:murein DD-endopeptidase MepM/ murein hydrolase activator NlpD
VAGFAALAAFLVLARPLGAEPNGDTDAPVLSAWLSSLAEREGIRLRGKERLGDAVLPMRLPLEVSSLPLALDGVNHVVSRGRDGSVESLYILARLPEVERARPPKPGDGGELALLPPLADARIASGFGSRADPFTGQPAQHNGVDFAAPAGTPVTAAAAGRVLQVARAPDLGLFVRLDHGGGRETVYAHLRETSPGLTTGRVLGAGQTLGRVGGSGRATGPHLHFELRVKGAPVEPAFAESPPRGSLALGGRN